MKKIKFPFDIDDLLVIVGMAGVFIGIWLIYHPAAYIIGGAGFIYIGLSGSRKNKTGG